MPDGDAGRLSPPPEEQEFGGKSAAEVAAAAAEEAGAGSASVVKALLDAAEVHTAGEPLGDDITVLSVSAAGEGGGQASARVGQRLGS